MIVNPLENAEQDAEVCAVCLENPFFVKVQTEFFFMVLRGLEMKVSL